MKRYNTMSFRISLLSAIGILMAVVAIIFSIKISQEDMTDIVHTNRKQMNEQNAMVLKTIVYSIYNRIEAYDNMLSEKLSIAMHYAGEDLKNFGGFDKINRMDMNFDAKVPSPIVDDIMKHHNAYSTIFRKLADGTMLRISTNIVMNGKRQVNTRITPVSADGTPNPMMQAVLSGNTFKGRANVLGKWVNAVYAPIKENGQVVGMIFVSSTEADSQNFIEEVRDSRYGHIFAVGTNGLEKGVLVMSMETSMAGAGKNTLDLVNSKGEYYWQQVMDFCKKQPKDSIGYTEINYKSDNGKEYPLAIAGMYYPHWDWAMGIAMPKEDLERAALEMQSSLEGSMRTLERTSYIVGIVVFIIMIIVTAIYANKLTKQIKLAVVTFGEVGKGDMTCRLDCSTKDEMSLLANQFNHLMDNLQKFIKEIVEDNSYLTTAAAELQTASEEVSTIAQQASSYSEKIVDETKSMVSNVGTIVSGAQQAGSKASEVANSAEQMSENMNSIAAAVEEMSASISQISSNTAQVQKIAVEATDKANDATTAMNKLGTAAKEIGQVTDVIKKIADKTNLLALNATIEAASAGEAGKGFAVVANEIKELANQSAFSADDITNRIESIQSETNSAVGVINGVSDIILKINQSVEDISGHVSQQTRVSNDVANTIAQANTGTKQVANAISAVAKDSNDVSNSANEVSTSIAHVKDSIVNVSEGAKNELQGTMLVRQKAEHLAKIAKDQKEAVSHFKL